MDLRKIKKLIELLEESNLNEIEIQEGEESIRLSRGVVAPVYADVPPVAAVTAPTASIEPVPIVEVTSDAPNIENALTSPMVGSFYTSPKPGDPSFVNIGDTVKVGDVLCIIEAMKIFNQIEADRAGKIVAILKDSGEPVEYGEPLFIIE